MAVTVKITLQDTPVEISAQVEDGAAVLEQVKAALQSQSGVLEFTDVKKHQYVVAASKIVAAQVSAEEGRRVGFAS